MMKPKAQLKYQLSSTKYTAEQISGKYLPSIPSFPAIYHATISTQLYEDGEGWVHWEASHLPNNMALMTAKSLRNGKQIIKIQHTPIGEPIQFPFYYRASQ